MLLFFEGFDLINIDGLEAPNETGEVLPPRLPSMLDLSVDVQHVRAPITAEDVAVRQVVFMRALICECANKERHVDATVDGVVSIDVRRNVQRVGNIAGTVEVAKVAIVVQD